MILTLEKIEFLELCYRVLDKIGKDSNEIIILGKEAISGKIYEDEVIYMASNSDKTLTEIYRKSVASPVIFISEGEAVLFSIDYVYLIDHLKSL